MSKTCFTHLTPFLELDLFDSVLGSNCSRICNEFVVNNISELNRRDIHMPTMMDESQDWRLPYLAHFLSLRSDNQCDIPDIVLNSHIDFVCCN